ncbi:MAG: hypothetical protein HFJ50_09640 [Clostridia bacterium]|nr:hypothetical protein [Clostridia bacterium]
MISKISDKIQIDKIAKFFKSSVVWILGIALTVFVSVLSLEGTLTSSVDRTYSKDNKSCCNKYNSSSSENYLERQLMQYLDVAIF